MKLDLAVRNVGCALLLAPMMAFAGPKSPVFVLDGITFKENGRLHEKIVAECNVDGALSKAVDRVLRRRQFLREARVAQLHLSLRVDKIANLGSSGRAGTEIGVTAIPANRDSERLFLCRKQLSPFQLSHCDRINECTKEIAEDVANWAKQFDAAAPSPKP